MVIALITFTKHGLVSLVFWNLHLWHIGHEMVGMLAKYGPIYAVDNCIFQLALGPYYYAKFSKNEEFTFP